MIKSWWELLFIRLVPDYMALKLLKCQVWRDITAKIGEALRELERKVPPNWDQTELIEGPARPDMTGPGI